MNKTIVIGNLCHTPELKSMGDTVVCNFDIAVNDYIKNENVATFFRISAWGKMGENCNKYLQKGSKVMVEGRISTRAYTSKEGEPKASLNLFAQNVEFLSSKGTTATVTEEEPADMQEITDEELPF